MVIITDIIGWTSRLTLRKCRNNQQQLLFGPTLNPTASFAMTCHISSLCEDNAAYPQRIETTHSHQCNAETLNYRGREGRDGEVQALQWTAFAMLLE